MLGKTGKPTPDDLLEKLAKQYRTRTDNGFAKAKAQAARFNGDYVNAYYYFLANHVNTKVRVKNFMLKQAGFTERSAFDVINSICKISIEIPTATAVNADIPKTSFSRPQQDEEVGSPGGVGGASIWIDPLNRCRIRIGGYADSIDNPTSARAKSMFGGRNGMHRGIDIDALPGTPIMAVSHGEVIFTGLGGTYGNVILLQVHINDLPRAQKDYVISKNSKSDMIYFLYAHLSGISVHKVGKKPLIVEAGQIIGKTGNTGNASTMTLVGAESGAPYGAHLHFEVRRCRSLKKGQGDWFDPKPLLNQCE